MDDAVLVNPKNRGIKNVIVWLRPDSTDPKAKFKPSEINPEDANRKPAEVSITQPCCVREPHHAGAAWGQVDRQ